MAGRKLGFEALRHHYDNAEYLVPLRMDENRNPSHQFTVPLLRAAELIAPRLADTEPTHRSSGRLVLGELVDQVGRLLTDDPRRLLIEGENGAGAIRVAQDAAKIVMRDQYRGEVPTSELFDMLYAWGELQTGETR